MTIDWHEPYQLTPIELDCVRKSIQQFQLGESSDGHHLLAQARRYSNDHHDPDYVPALQLFIKEEQRHAGYLAQFLDTYGVSLTKKHPVDSVFRLIRHLFNLELSVMAMLSAEIIAVPYYKALHDATRSPLLRQICRQILRDEIRHLQFQAETLSAIRSTHGYLNRVSTSLFHRLLLTWTVLIVWQQHHAVFAAGNHTFAQFWRISWVHFNRLFLKTNLQLKGITQ
jgi:hypothetical protein